MEIADEWIERMNFSGIDLIKIMCRIGGQTCFEMELMGYLAEKLRWKSRRDKYWNDCYSDFDHRTYSDSARWEEKVHYR